MKALLDIEPPLTEAERISALLTCVANGIEDAGEFSEAHRVAITVVADLIGDRLHEIRKAFQAACEAERAAAPAAEPLGENSGSPST